MPRARNAQHTEVSALKAESEVAGCHSMGSVS